MSSSKLLILLTLCISQAYTIPQFISFKDGKLGVNFAGFHAGIGIGGALGSGGLYAEAGTPFGQSAKAGLDGSLNEKGEMTGRLFAGATGAPTIKVSTGLAGIINRTRSIGGGFASAQAGNRTAFSNMLHDTSVQILPENEHTNTSNVHTNASDVHTNTSDVHTNANDVHPPGKKHHKRDLSAAIVSTNEVKPLQFIPQNTEVQKIEEKNNISPPVIEQVYIEQQPQVVDKHVIHTNDKPRHHNTRKTAFLGGYIGPGGEIVPPAEKTQTVNQRNINVDAEATATANTDGNSSAGQTYTKLVSYHRNPSFFQDIFNIPISTLRAVGNLLSNTAANTNISVQKSASVQAAESDSISLKHDPSSVSSSSAHISVETPSASKLIDDIFAIPINTLGAVNKFLENNVAGRKNIQVRREGGEPTRIKLGPHARRRANKRVVIVQETPSKVVEEET